MELKFGSLRKNKFGLDPTTGSDAAFYDWIAGDDVEQTAGEVFMWLIDDLREVTDQKEIQDLLEVWREDCDATEFSNRLLVLTKLLPENHAFHHIKHLYVSE